MPIINDKTFGTITIRRSVKSRQITIRLSPNGTLRASAPVYTPIAMIRRVVRNSRTQLEKMISSQRPAMKLEPGMEIGKSHMLIVRNGSRLSIKRAGQQIQLTLPEGTDINDTTVLNIARPAIIEALRREAKSYLPKRLAYLAKQHSFSYEKIRFSHSSGRWGSCSNNGTISLNIALMKLPFELIDYVLIHELSHTKEMNHSDRFWNIVARIDPGYAPKRTRIKHETPYI